MSRARWFPLALFASLAGTLVFLALPVVAIFLQSSPGELIHALGRPAATEALRLSLLTSGLAMVAILFLGTPAAYLLATRRFRGRALAVTLVELPLVLPPAVAGIGLLYALGPSGVLGGTLEGAGVRLVFETAGVVVALSFVAGPLYVRQALAAFERLDRSWLDASRTAGHGEAATFARIAIPAAKAGLGAGTALALGRALGEFGATLVFAGSLRGVTQTAPLAIVELFGTEPTAALALSAVLVAVAAALLLSVKLVFGREGIGDASR